MRRHKKCKYFQDFSKFENNSPSDLLNKAFFFCSFSRKCFPKTISERSLKLGKFEMRQYGFLFGQYRSRSECSERVIGFVRSGLGFTPADEEIFFSQYNFATDKQRRLLSFTISTLSADFMC